MSKAASAIARITREISQAQKNKDLSIAVACRDSDVRHLRALIIGSFNVLRTVTGRARWLI
jgi:ubiquitin-conjugating enzyme E2 Z